MQRAIVYPVINPVNGGSGKTTTLHTTECSIELSLHGVLHSLSPMHEMASAQVPTGYNTLELPYKYI